MQRTQFRAKSEKNDFKLTDFLKRNFYFETEGVLKRALSHESNAHVIYSKFYMICCHPLKLCDVGTYHNHKCASDLKILHFASGVAIRLGCFNL